MSPAAPGLDVERPASPARRAAVSRALATIADQVAQLPEPYVRALQPVLLQAQDELAAGLRRWLATAPDAEARFTAQHLRNALVQTRHALEHMERVVPIGVEGTLRAMGVASGALATRHLQEEVAVFAGVFGHSVRPVQLQQAAIIAEGRQQLIPQFRSSAKRYGANIAADIRHQMAIGLASGETFSQLTDRLQRHGGPRGLVSLAGVLGEAGAQSEYIAEGLFKKYRGWAARVVRTEGNDAYNAHALIGLERMNEDDPGYQKRWDATADRRSCEICARLDGVIVDLDKPFPGGVMHSPIHPNDRCCVTPWRPEWAKRPVAPPTAPEVIAVPPPALPAVRPPEPADDRAWKRAVNEMARTPMAKEYHPRCDVEAFERDPKNAARKADFENELRHIFGKRITLEEVTHGFAVPPGLRAELASVAVDLDGKARISFRIKDGERTAGTLDRFFHTHGGKGAVEHDLLLIKDEYQGRGISDHINGSALLRYKKWGVENATVSAAWVGRYAWARMGFSFEYPADMFTEFSDWATRRYAKTPHLLPGVLSKAERLIHDEPWTFAKWQEGDVKVGNEFLLDGNTPVWKGVLPINDSSGGYANAARLLKLETKE